MLRAVAGGAAVMLGLLGLSSLLPRSATRQNPALVGTLTDRQRALLGLPQQGTAPAAGGQCSTPAAALGPAPPAGLTPPLSGSDRGLGQAAQPSATPEPPAQTTTPHLSGRKSVFRNPSPSEFAGMLADFAARPTTPQQPPSASPYDMHALGSAGLGLGGGASPTYRPSLLPRGKTVAVHRGGERQLTPSPLDLRKVALDRLKLTEDELQTCTEALREWMALDVLQPLVEVMDSAHLAVEETAAKLGLPGIRLSPLGSPAPTVTSVPSTARGGVDDETMVVQLRDQIIARLRPTSSFSLTPPPPPPPEALLCLQAIANYQQLSTIIKGEAPPNILPATPRGYLPSRIRSLAVGPCAAAFEWNSGGHYDGKMWSLELPNDSVLLLYIFAAFLVAPHWHFLQDPATSSSQVDGGQAPLYLGKLPARVSGPYFAILPIQPPANHQATAIVGTQLSSASPLFSLLLRGEVVVTSEGRSALWDVLTLFLRHCALECHGAVASRSLGFLGVSNAVSPLPGAWRPKRHLLPLMGW